MAALRRADERGPRRAVRVCVCEHGGRQHSGGGALEVSRLRSWAGWKLGGVWAG